MNTELDKINSGHLIEDARKIIETPEPMPYVALIFAECKCIGT